MSYGIKHRNGTFSYPTGLWNMMDLLRFVAKIVSAKSMTNYLSSNISSMTLLRQLILSGSLQAELSMSRLKSL